MHVPDDYNINTHDDLVTALEKEDDDMEEDDDVEEEEDVKNPLSKEERSYRGCTRGEMNVFVENEEDDLCNFFHKHVYTIEMSLVDEERRASLRCLIEATHTGILFRVASNHEMRDVIIAFAKRAYPADKFSVVDISLQLVDERRFFQQYDSCLRPFQETKEGMNLHLSTFDELLLQCLVSSDHVYDDEDEDKDDEGQLDDDGMSLSMKDWLDMDLPDENEIEDPDYQAPCVQAPEVIEILDDDDDDVVEVEVEVCERESFIEILSRYF